MTLEQAVAHCTELTKVHSSTFYLGSRLFPTGQRRAVSVIYAVCRSGDDAVDEASSAELGQARLDAWWQHVMRAYRGTPRAEEPLELGLTWVLENHEVPKSAFEELHLGLGSDLSHDRCYETMDDLMLYCRRVAGVVGLLIAPIPGYRGGDETLACAVALGQAMQLTNILRDVGEDLAMGRCYIPNELLDKYDVALEDLRDGEVSEGYVALLEDLFDLTSTLYRHGWQGIPKLKGFSATAVGVAALNYEGILRKVRQNHYDNLTRRAYLKPVERIALIPRAVVGVYGSFL